MRLRRSARFALLLVVQGLLTSASGGAPSSQSPQASPLGQRLMGQWARSIPACRRPELILEKDSATVQTDTEGQALAFSYDAARYSSDGPDRVTVELGKFHPYGETSSRTALTFKVVSPNEIDLLQAKKAVSFKRCRDRVR